MNNYRSAYGYPQQTAYGRCKDGRCSDNRHTDDCCDATTKFPENPVVAMAYVPFQECNDVYPCEKAMSRGTIFPVLDKPLLVGCCR